MGGGWKHTARCSKLDDQMWIFPAGKETAFSISVKRWDRLLQAKLVKRLADISPKLGQVRLTRLGRRAVIAFTVRNELSV